MKCKGRLWPGGRTPSLLIADLSERCQQGRSDHGIGRDPERHLRAGAELIAEPEPTRVIAAPATGAQAEIALDQEGEAQVALFRIGAPRCIEGGRHFPGRRLV